MDVFLYWMVAVVVSLFYGLFAIRIFVRSENLPQDIKDAPPWSFTYLVRRPQYVHQCWFKFAGSFIGWCAGYYLVFKRQLSESPADLNDIFLLLVTILGVTGHLPLSTFGVATALGTLAKKGIEWLANKLLGRLRTEESANEQRHSRQNTPTQDP